MEKKKKRTKQSRDTMPSCSDYCRSVCSSGSKNGLLLLVCVASARNCWPTVAAAVHDEALEQRETRRDEPRARAIACVQAAIASRMKAKFFEYRRLVGVTGWPPLAAASDRDVLWAHRASTSSVQQDDASLSIKFSCIEESRLVNHQHDNALKRRRLSLDPRHTTGRQTSEQASAERHVETSQRRRATLSSRRAAGLRVAVTSRVVAVVSTRATSTTAAASIDTCGWAHVHLSKSHVIVQRPTAQSPPARQPPTVSVDACKSTRR